MGSDTIPKVQTRHFFHPVLSGKQLGRFVERWPGAHAIDLAEAHSFKSVRRWRRQVSSHLEEDLALRSRSSGGIREYREDVISVYHDGWGIDLLADLDAAAHKVLYLHGFYPYWERHLAFAIRFASGLAVPYEALKEWILKTFPWIPERFVLVWPLPVKDPPASPLPSSTPVAGIWLRSGFRDWNRLRSAVDRLRGEFSHISIQCVFEGRKIPRTLASCRVDPEESKNWNILFQLQDWIPVAIERLYLAEQGTLCLLPDGDIFEALGETSLPHYSYGNWADLGVALERLLQEGPDPRKGLEAHLGDASLNKFEEGLETLINRRSLRIHRTSPRRQWRPLRWYHAMFGYRMRGVFRY